MSDEQPPRRTFTYRFPAIPENPTGWRKELVQILEGNSAVIPTENEIDGLFACLENFIQEELVPRPRCENCRWWKSRDELSAAGVERTDPGFGLCELGDGRSEKVSSIYGDGIQTASDFGCTEWESREERK